MKSLLSILLGAAMLFLQAPAQAQERIYNQAELDGLLAPVALYPDPLLSQILVAATYPADVAEAAAWSRANAHLRGEDAVRAAQYEPWDPSVKSLLAFPDILARMAESPQWLMDLGQAFLAQEPHVMNTIQELRRRAQASGYLNSNEHYSVQQQGPAIAVVPVQPQVVYVPYYDPYVVYGPWWWPGYRPVAWRPWRPAPVMVSANFFYGAVDWHQRHVRVVQRPAAQVVQQPPVTNSRPIVQSAPAPARIESTRRIRIPESQRQPIVQSAPISARPAEREQQAVRPRTPPASHVQASHRHQEKERKPHPDRAQGRDRHG